MVSVLVNLPKWLETSLSIENDPYNQIVNLWLCAYASRHGSPFVVADLVLNRLAERMYLDYSVAVNIFRVFSSLAEIDP